MKLMQVSEVTQHADDADILRLLQWAAPVTSVQSGGCTQHTYVQVPPGVVHLVL